MSEHMPPGVYIDESSGTPPPIEGVPTSVAAFIGFFKQGPLNKAVLITSMKDLEDQFGGLDSRSEASYGIQQFLLNDGEKAWVVRVGVGAEEPLDAATIIGDPTARTGIYALDNVDVFNLLCIPCPAEVGGETGTLSARGAQAVIREVLDYCEKRRALFLMDPPGDLHSPLDVENWLATNSFLRHRNAAMYYPRISIPDKLNRNQPRSVGPGGTMAGVIARIDNLRGVWKAPAGTEATLRNVLSVESNVNDEENERLNSLGVNCLRGLPGYGTVCWGARTLCEDPEWRYIPVRRLTLQIEESIYRGTQWAVFEPNDESLWARVRSAVNTFMLNLWRSGALQGSTPEEACFVRCDNRTTTQGDIDNHMFNVTLGFAAVKPGEFIILKIQQKSAQQRAPACR